MAILTRDIDRAARGSKDRLELLDPSRLRLASTCMRVDEDFKVLKTFNVVCTVDKLVRR